MWSFRDDINTLIHYLKKTHAQINKNRSFVNTKESIKIINVMILDNR